MSKNFIKENLQISKMVNTGLGLAKDDGLTVFVEDVVTGDIIDAKVISHNKNYQKALIDHIRKSSDHRVEPFCSLANVCGGCQWQYISYDYQLEAKREIVQDCLQKIAGIDVHVRPTMPASNTKNYRCKVQYPVAQTKVSKRILAGYYKKGTHEIINIKHCPIQPKIIDDVVQFFRDKAQELELTAYDEAKHKGTLRHIIFRYSKSENNMVVTLVVNDRKIHQKIRELATLISEQFPSVVGVVANFNTDKTNKIIGEKSQTVIGKDFIVEKIKGVKYKISAGSFFQVNIDSAQNILDTVKELVRKNCQKPRILDAYSGVGTFGLYLSSVADTIVAVEDYPQAVADAQANIKMNMVDNIELIEGDAKNIFLKLEAVGEKFDLVIIDPPRKGCDAEALDSVCNLSSKHIIYVSCNPATLARDAKILQEKGFELKSAQPVDMFCHTYHIETVAFFEKK
ncbi:MAG: 23S rRNA (uracil(1939)-C(5))-methyltransferase RlmD [Candidatus Gastranaerophilales bacterium]|nr:23S rRNA (uracil(1939)-C(5))-methyltransferase RlmD [Candidatus Gastranaerophilales bacterium]